MKTSGSAVWQGGVKDGRGVISTRSGALSGIPYGFPARFEGRPGSNPEELIGAAHAACFTMALTLALAEFNLTADQIEATGEVTLERQPGGFAITGLHLVVRAAVPGATEEMFQRCARKAEAACPVSKLSNAPTSLEASLTRG